MAKAHSKSDNPINKVSKTERYYTVGYVTQSSGNEIPSIHLKGKWLTALGFNTGTKVNIKVMDGCLVITPEAAIITEAKQMLSQLNQLNERLSHYQAVKLAEEPA